MDTNRLKQQQHARLRVAADRAFQIFRLAHRYGLSAEAAEELYDRANGDWSMAGELAKEASSYQGRAGLTDDSRSAISEGGEA